MPQPPATLIAASGLERGAWRAPEFVEQFGDAGVHIEVAEDERKSVELDLIEVTAPL